MALVLELDLNITITYLPPMYEGSRSVPQKFQGVDDGNREIMIAIKL